MHCAFCKSHGIQVASIQQDSNRACVAILVKVRNTYKNPLEILSFFSVNDHKVYSSRSSLVALERHEGDCVIVNFAFPHNENTRLRMQEKTNTHDQQ